MEFLLAMVITQGRPKRTATGSRYKKFRKKREFESASMPMLTRIGTQKSKTVRVIGGNQKTKLLLVEFVNVFDQKKKKSVKTKIKSVLESPANRHYVRRNIVTRGTVIDTELGKARVTSRPAQDGILNAVLIS